MASRQSNGAGAGLAVLVLGGGLFALLAGRSRRARAAVEDGFQLEDLSEIGRGAAEEAIDMARSISKYFTLAEWTRSDTAQARGISNVPDTESLDRLEDTSAMLDRIRDLVGDQLLITSGYRSPALNKALGGATGSQHGNGEAADVKAPSLGTWQATPLAKLILDAGIEFDQMIGYPPALGGHIHISFTRRRANRREVLWSPTKKDYLPWDPHTQPNGEGVA